MRLRTSSRFGVDCVLTRDDTRVLDVLNSEGWIVVGTGASSVALVRPSG